MLQRLRVVAARLLDRGHDVVDLGDSGMVFEVRPRGARLMAVPDRGA
jgi:hypothetical protein